MRLHRPDRTSSTVSARAFVFVLALSACLFLAPAVVVAEESPFAGHWEGSIEVPGTPLELDVDFAAGDDGSLTGDVSIPVQGIRDMALADVEASAEGGEERIHFRIPDVPGDPTFDGSLADDGSRIEGTFTQGGGELPFELSRTSKAERATAALDGFGEVVQAAIDDWNVPGAGVAVVAGGEVVFAQGFGYRDFENQLPMTPDTLFAIGSTTKAMTTTVLGMLVDEGAVSWDRPVRHDLPWFDLQDPYLALHLTPRDLVTHRSGLPRHDLLWYNNQEVPRREMVERLAHVEASAGLREKYQYNNMMYLTAGVLIEELTGGSWEEAVRSRLFEPLGMERSNFSVDDSKSDPDHALPHRENDDDEIERIPFRKLDVMGPAGSVNSSVREMSRWLLFNLDRGHVDGQQLINPTTLAEIHTPQMTTGALPDRADVSQRSYAMGWDVDSYRGHRRIAHGGGIDGFITSVMFFPDDGVGVVAFTNSISPLPSLFAQHAADRVLELEPIDWLGEAQANRDAGEAAQEEGEGREQELRLQGTDPSYPLDDYAGEYHHPGYGLLKIAAADGEGRGLEMTYNGITAPLEHWHRDVWNGADADGDDTFEGMKLLFRGNFDGIIAEVLAPFEPQVDPIVFAKRPPARLSDPEYLERFAGDYQFPSQKATVALQGGVLSISLPGQPLYTLVPTLSGRFQLEQLSFIQIEFQLDPAGKVTGLTSYQPNGTFEANKVEESPSEE